MQRWLGDHRAPCHTNLDGLRSWHDQDDVAPTCLLHCSYSDRRDTTKLQPASRSHGGTWKFVDMRHMACRSQRIGLEAGEGDVQQQQ